MLKPASFLWVSLVLAAGLLFLSCHSQPSTQQIWKDNQQKWNDQKLGNYSFQLQVGCFSPPDITRPVNITVKEGIPKLAYADDGTPVTNKFFDDYNTIDKLFSTALRALENADAASVSYDEKYGFPARINIDFNKKLVDDEMSYTIADFQLLESR